MQQLYRNDQGVLGGDSACIRLPLRSDFYSKFKIAIAYETIAIQTAENSLQAL